MRLHTKISPLHHYQLGVIFLFVFSFFLFIPFLMFLDEFNLDNTTWGWYFIIPWGIIYTIYSLRLRNKVKPEQRISPLKRPIGHWAILGIIIIYINVLKPNEFQKIYPAINFAFLIFSLFLADSYWDFKKLRVLRKKK